MHTSLWQIYPHCDSKPSRYRLVHASGVATALSRSKSSASVSSLGSMFVMIVARGFLRKKLSAQLKLPHTPSLPLIMTFFFALAPLSPRCLVSPWLYVSVATTFPGTNLIGVNAKPNTRNPHREPSSSALEFAPTVLSK